MDQWTGDKNKCSEKCLQLSVSADIIYVYTDRGISGMGCIYPHGRTVISSQSYPKARTDKDDIWISIGTGGDIKR